MPPRSRKAPKRNLEEEFEHLLPLYKLRAKEHVDRFAELYISTLQEEKNQVLWSDLSEKFPLSVRIYTMQAKRKSFRGRLRLAPDVADRWVAVLELQRQDSRLKKMSDSDEQCLAVANCLERCRTLMLKMVIHSKPLSVAELRELLDGTYDYDLQLRMLEEGRRKFLNILPFVMTKEQFVLFKEGIRVGKLYNLMVLDPASGRQAYEEAADKMVQKLHDEAVAGGVVVVAASRFPTVVQHRALGLRQCVLMRRLVEKHGGPCTDELVAIRGLVAALKDELNPETEIETKVELLKNLRSSFRRTTKGSPKAQTKLIRKELRTLPVKMLLNAIRWGDTSDIRTTVFRVLDSMPPRFAVLPLLRFKDRIVQVAPFGFEKEVSEAIDEYLEPLIRPPSGTTASAP
jgi:hypothetical protein